MELMTLTEFATSRKEDRDDGSTVVNTVKRMSLLCYHALIRKIYGDNLYMIKGKHGALID